jgi:CDGSH-type Zn-finger protein
VFLDETEAAMDEKASRMRISVISDGPFAVTGAPLVRQRITVNDEGVSSGWETVERLDVGEHYSLCRCGSSCAKPFCDGTHERVGFDGTETAEHDSYADVADAIEGPGVVLYDATKLCASARHCYLAGGVWHLVPKCDDPEVRELAEGIAMLCPSGRYVMSDAETHAEVEPDLEARVGLVEDPHLGVSGGLWVQGGIEVVSSDGEPYEVRNRVTLCRCGHSKNKPFCDGSHIKARFREVAE